MPRPSPSPVNFTSSMEIGEPLDAGSRTLTSALAWSASLSLQPSGTARVRPAMTSNWRSLVVTRRTLLHHAVVVLVVVVVIGERIVPVVGGLLLAADELGAQRGEQRDAFGAEQVVRDVEATQPGPGLTREQPGVVVLQAAARQIEVLEPGPPGPVHQPVDVAAAGDPQRSQRGQLEAGQRGGLPGSELAVPDQPSQRRVAESLDARAADPQLEDLEAGQQLVEPRELASVARVAVDTDGQAPQQRPRPLEHDGEQRPKLVAAPVAVEGMELELAQQQRGPMIEQPPQQDRALVGPGVVDRLAEGRGLDEPAVPLRANDRAEILGQRPEQRVGTLAQILGGRVRERRVVGLAGGGDLPGDQLAEGIVVSRQPVAVDQPMLEVVGRV